MCLPGSVFSVHVCLFTLYQRLAWSFCQAGKGALNNMSDGERSEQPANLSSHCLMKEENCLCYISSLEWLWCTWCYSIIICVFLSYYFQQINVAVFFFSNPVGQKIIEKGGREVQGGSIPKEITTFFLNLKDWKKMHLKRMKLLNIVHVAKRIRKDACVCWGMVYKRLLRAAT